MAVIPHNTGAPAAYETDRADAGVVFPEEVFVTGLDLNDMQRLERLRSKRASDLIARDGDRVSGADIVIVRNAAPATTVTATLAAGRIYLDGDVRDVAERIITSVPGTGEVRVGVRLRRTVATHLTDTALVGPHPGSEAEGEPIGQRVVETAIWALETETQPGTFFTVYTLLDGIPVDQIEPPALSPVIAQIAVYDKDANGNYIVEGCDVTAFGRVGTDQVFSIKEGRANILGFKRVREYSLRVAEPEAPDLEQINAEPQTYTAATGAANVITVNRPPIASVQTVIVVKRITETVVRGTTPGGLDALSKSSVVGIESVVQGGTTYVQTTSYVLAGSNVSWAPGGPEPAASSSYDVTYLYNEAQAVDSVTATTVTVSGGVNGRPILVTYTSKVPRVDLICLDITGAPVYVKGISARTNAVPPPTPSSLLKLAEVWNDWLNVPRIVNNGTRNYTYDSQRRLFDRLIDMLDQFDRSQSARDILEREPVSKRGIFTDVFTDDVYRDQGLAQTAASAAGVLQLAIDPVLNLGVNTAFRHLPFTEQIVVRQDLRTSGMRINPYANFTAMPAALTLEPPVDFWTETNSVWTSDITREFQAAPGQPPGSTTITEQVDETLGAARFLRVRAVTFTIDGFGAGENLATLTFDGIDVKPSGTQTANSAGQITGSFNIPANVPVGRRLVEATGAAGSFCRAIYVGDGSITTLTLRRVTLVAREAPPPVTVIQQTIINQVSQIVTVWDQPTFARDNGRQLDQDGGGNGGMADPLAQTFSLNEPRMIVGLNFWIDAIGDRINGVRVQLANVQNGFPTNEVLAEVFISMATPNVGDMVQARFRAPVFCEVGREYAFVILTDDADHAVKVAKLGDVYDLGDGRQGRVSSQPYTTGVLLASANRLTWTPVQEADLAFQVVAANFTATETTVSLWTGAFSNISDVVVRAGLEIPSAQTTIRFEIVRASGEVIRFAERQQVPFSDFVTETVTLRAVLSGTARLSPIMFPGALLIAGRIRTSGTYVTRVFPMGTAIRVRAIFAALLPAGASITVAVDAVNNVWTNVPSISTGVLGGGWNEPVHELTPYTAASGGRIRITLNGGPGARPFVARLRAYSV
jgi:hypothetical protein